MEMIHKINKDAFKEMAESNSSILCNKNNSQLLWILLLKLSELIFCNLEPPPKYIHLLMLNWPGGTTKEMTLVSSEDMEEYSIIS